MDFGLSEDQVLFKNTLRRFLDTECPTARVREVMETDGGHDPRLWAKLVELGVSGLVVPAELGGSEQELLDLALAAEELGFACTPGPFLGNAVATVALKESGDVACDLLRSIASGDTLATVALGEDESEWSPSAYKTRVDAGKLTGVKPLVPFAADADVFVVGARDS
jgi:alkylation response protein AidB-like acyl-CoA dehydrogenase